MQNKISYRDVVMNNIKEHIKNRRSVRTYDGRELDKNRIEKLIAFANTIENPFNIPVKFKLMKKKQEKLQDSQKNIL